MIDNVASGSVEVGELHRARPDGYIADAGAGLAGGEPPHRQEPAVRHLQELRLPGACWSPRRKSWSRKRRRRANFGELVAYLQAHPAILRSAGTASAGQREQRAAVLAKGLPRLSMCPAKGAAALLLTDLLAALPTTPSRACLVMLPHIKSGKIRKVTAVSSPRRFGATARRAGAVK